jgi:hypothetical protein
MRIPLLLFTAALTACVVAEPDDDLAYSSESSTDDARAYELATHPADDDAAFACAEPTAIRTDFVDEFVLAHSARELEALDGVTFTADPGDTTLHVDNGGSGTVYDCRCDSGCGGSACTIEVGPFIANCSGTCDGVLSDDGKPCFGCGWHTTPPAPGPGGISKPKFPTLPKPLPPLPSAPQELDDLVGCAGDPESVVAGMITESFTVISAQEIQLHEGLDFTVDPDSGVQHLDNDPFGSGFVCRCDGGCTEAGDSPCSTMDGAFPGNKLCTGGCSGTSSDGGSCSLCSWHVTQSPTPAGGISKPKLPLPKPLPPLPSYP